MKRLFVTGTDTSAGKTYVTAALARRARDLGKKVFAFKPIETGCELVEGRRLGTDQELLCAAAGDWQTGPLRGLYQLARPLAPSVAARAENVHVDLDLIASTAESVRDVDLLLVEGAGGWRVPLSDHEDISDLAKRVASEVVIAARAGLGTISHSLLTVEAVERDGFRVAAVVLSRRPIDDRDLALSNREQILKRWHGRVFLLEADPAILDPVLR